MPRIYIRDLEFHASDETEFIRLDDGRIDVSSYTPKDPTDFSLNVNIAVSWDDSDGIWRFNVYVCSPKAMLSGKLREDRIFSGRSYIIMQEYDEVALRNYIESYVSDLHDLPYTQQIERMCRLGDWECEDCRNSDGSPFVTHDIIFHDKDDLLEKTKE